MINDSSACRRLSCSLALCTRWQVQRGPSGNCFNFPDIVTSVSCTQHTHVYQPGWSVIFFFYPHRKGDEKDLKSVSTAQLLWVHYILLCRKQFGFQPWVEKHKVEQEQKKSLEFIRTKTTTSVEYLNALVCLVWSSWEMVSWPVLIFELGGCVLKQTSTPTSDSVGPVLKVRE